MDEIEEFSLSLPRRAVPLMQFLLLYFVFYFRSLSNHTKPARTYSYQCKSSYGCVHLSLSLSAPKQLSEWHGNYKRTFVLGVFHSGSPSRHPLPPLSAFATPVVLYYFISTSFPPQPPDAKCKFSVIRSLVTAPLVPVKEKPGETLKINSARYTSSYRKQKRPKAFWLGQINGRLTREV